jgi:hypothetical protein
VKAYERIWYIPGEDFSGVRLGRKRGARRINKGDWAAEYIQAHPRIQLLVLYR